MKGIDRPGQAGRRLLWGFVLYLGLLTSVQGHAEEEAQLKAAFIYNFTKYVTWPLSIEQASGTLRVCVVGKKAYSDEIAQLNGREVRTFELEVVPLSLTDSMTACHVLYLSGLKPDKVLGMISTLPILTISDEPGFASLGGIIGLITEGRRIRFDINLGRARDAQLQISSRLLQLARRVE